jgi:HD-like signal output (HDOD) protein
VDASSDCRKTVTIAKHAANGAPAGNIDPLGFVRKLTAELAAGDVHLPSFPDFTARVLKVLEDPRATPAQVAQVAGADAALAARVLRLANSPFMNSSSARITDLQRAVTRLGHQLVRCTALSFALKQMELGSDKAYLRPQLQDLWRKGTLVASIAFVLARETRAASPDQALVTGLMHNVGRLYIAVSAPRQGVDDSDGAWTDVVHQWHPQIARAILIHWEFPSAVAAAVGDQNNWNRDLRGGDALTDILIAAEALVPCVFYRSLLDDVVTSVPPFKRLGLDAADCQRLLLACAQQIKALQATLSG